MRSGALAGLRGFAVISAPCVHDPGHWRRGSILATGEDLASEIPGDQEPETILGKAFALLPLLAAEDAVGAQRESFR